MYKLSLDLKKAFDFENVWVMLVTVLAPKARQVNRFTERKF